MRKTGRGLESAHFILILLLSSSCGSNPHDESTTSIGGEGWRAIQGYQDSLEVMGQVRVCADADRMPYLVLVLDLATSDGAYPMTVSLIRSTFWYVRPGQGTVWKPIPQGNPEEAVSETSGFQTRQAVRGRIIRSAPRRTNPIFDPTQDHVQVEIVFSVTDVQGRSVCIRESLPPVPVGSLRRGP